MVLSNFLFRFDKLFSFIINEREFLDKLNELLDLERPDLRFFIMKCLKTNKCPICVISSKLKEINVHLDDSTIENMFGLHHQTLFLKTIRYISFLKECLVDYESVSKFENYLAELIDFGCVPSNNKLKS